MNIYIFILVTYLLCQEIVLSCYCRLTHALILSLLYATLLGHEMV